jgi:hypothetical protein
VDTSSLTGSKYQLDKFVKHTAPQGNYNLNSVFASSSYQSYRDWLVDATASGSLEVDDMGRHNLVYVAGEKTGVTYLNGSFHTDCNAVKVVLPYSSGSIHAFPTSSADLRTGTCPRCGGPLTR